MTLRRGCVLCWFVCLGCHAIAFPDDDDGRAQPPTSGDVALGYYDQTVASHPAATRSELSLAAEQLQHGNQAAACDHLGKYLQAHPQHLEVRVHYAELLAALERRQQAAREYARVIAEAQERGEQTLRVQIQAHLHLMELADANGDSYGRRLHRGIGLYLLALERSKLGDPAGELPVEALLCRAAAELTAARA